MKFANQLDDLLPGETGETLGRLLIDYQGLEAAIRSCLDVAFAAVDPLGVVLLWAGTQTAQFKIDVAKRVLDLAAETFGIADAPFAGTYPIAVKIPNSGESSNDEGIEQAFAGMRLALSRAKELVEYRNSLFHGRVEIEGDSLRFIGRLGKSLGDVAAFQNKRQEIIAAIFNLLLAASSVGVALEYLVQKKDNTEQS